MAATRNITLGVKLNGTDKFKRDMSQVNSALKVMGGWLETAKGVLASQLITKGLTLLKDGITDCFDASVAFDDAMAGVAKTTDMSNVQLQQMANQLMDLSEQIPVTATELAGIAESAGQLGIAQKDIVAFTEVVAAMGVSTNLSTDEAATALARFANVMGTQSDEYERLGSVIVDLGNNSATTEADILEMAQNMAGAANIVGITEDQVLAYAAALSSVGQESAVGASTMQKLWIQIEQAAASGGQSLNQFASIAGMTGEAFADLWNSDANSATMAFIHGLQQIDKAGGSVATTLSDTGINEIRMTRALLAIAGADDLLANSVELANNAWRENTALGKEAETRYETLASRLQIAKNAATNLETAIGDTFSGYIVGKAEDLGAAAADLRKSLTDIDISSTIRQATSDLESETQSLENTKKTAHSLVDALDALGDVDGLDASGQTKYIATLNAIAEIVPGLASSFDAETGAIEGGTAALRERVDENFRMEQTKIAYEQAAEAADAYAIALENQQKREQELALLNAQYNSVLGERDAMLERYHGGEMGLDTQIIATNVQLMDLEEQIGGVEDEIAAGAIEIDKYAYVVDGLEKATTAYGDSVDATANGADAMNQQTTQAISGLETLSAMLDETRVAYDAAYDEIMLQVDSAISGMQNIEMVEPSETAGDWVDNLQSQLDYMAQYQKNLQKVLAMGYSTDVVGQYLDGSSGSAEALATMAGATEDEVATINAKYAEVQTAKDTLVKDLAAAQTDLDTTVETIVSSANEIAEGCNVSGEMYAAGAQDIQSLIDGINAKIPYLRQKAALVQSLTRSAGGTTGYNGSHASGLEYVPFDGYVAQLHRGEMVLTAMEARAYRAQENAGNAALAALYDNTGRSVTTTSNATSVNTVRYGDIYVRDKQDVKLLSEEQAKLMRRYNSARGIR